MGVVFSEGRQMPKALRHQMAGYGYAPRFGEENVLTGVADIVQKASPWDFLSAWLFEKPAAEAAAQARAIEFQSQAYAAQQAQQAKTLRTVAIAGAALVGVLALVMVARRRKAPAKVSGYRRRKRR